jgi:hydroxysqualene dehydroxylase
VTQTAFVLGAGVAGLVAAFGLRERGYRVRLLESRSWLGGRAFSSDDEVIADRLDNGPHVMLGCYRALRALLRRLGTEDGFQQDPALTLAYRRPHGAVARLSLSRLPVPLAMPWALGRLDLSWRDRWRSLRGMLAVLRSTPANATLGDWLDARGQRGAPDAHLWRPLCRAVMNCEPEEASAVAFLSTLREAFLGRASSAAFWLPKRPWQALIGDPAAVALVAAGVEVLCGARVDAFTMTNGIITRIVLANGEPLVVEPTDLVVSALPWFALAPLLPSLPAALAFGALRPAPIVSAYVRIADDRAPLADDGPVVALVDGAPFHFVLRRPGDDPRRFALLSGGDRSFDGQTVATIAERTQQQLLHYFPDAQLDGAIVRIRKEYKATFVAAPGADPLRPPPGRLTDGPRNLLVCGDWTATGFPATLEGAARSAEAMLRALDS